MATEKPVCNFDPDATTPLLACVKANASPARTVC